MSRPVRHPAPATIGDYLQHLGRLLVAEQRHEPRATRCGCIECAASVLAAHGWPASTIGDGRGNGGELTPVEAAAVSEPLFPGLDLELARALRTLWASARLVEDKIALIRAHGSDSEKMAGRGPCLRCPHSCDPKKNPNDRLRSGLCPRCDTAWHRWKRDRPNPMRSDFIRAHKAKGDAA